MAQDIPFLLAPHFSHTEVGPEKFYCSECATLEGVLSYQPELTQQLDIRRIAFPRPRPEIIDLIGADLQSAPVLVVGDETRAPLPEVKTSPSPKRSYVSGLKSIAAYLTAAYQADRLHP
jgi:hypothetical protein